MSELIQKNINLTFARGGSASVGIKNTPNEFWNAINRINEENKFYLPMRGRGELFIDGTHYPLTRGRWFFIGAWESRSYYTTGSELEKWVVHFYGQADGGYIKETLDLPDFVDLTEEEYEKALFLMQRVQNRDMQSPANLYELFENKGKVFDILSYYIELSRKKNMHYIKNRDFDAGIRKRIFEYISVSGVRGIDVREVSNILGMNERYFLKYFKKLFLITPNQLTLKKRMVTAQTFLIFGNDDIADIAKECGFESTSYFCECFKKHMGISPLQFRRDYIKKMKINWVR